MKKHYLILIVLAIILAHVAVVLFCLGGGKPQKPGKDNTPAAPEKKAVSSVVPDQQTGSPAVRTPAVSAGDRQKAAGDSLAGSAQPQKKPLQSLKKDPPLNYALSWQGNIPELPRSRGARAGILVDSDTGRVLWHKKAQESFQIASMTKVMTSLLAYEDILSGRKNVTLSTPVKVSYAAQKIGGSQVWLDTTETFTMEELLKAVSIKSANDAAYLVAEYLGGGDVHSFVERMNRRARELGMLRTRFYNPHGLPGDTARTDNVSSPEDMVFLARKTLQYPKLMEWASTVRTDFRKPGSRGHLVIENHNHLLPGRRYPANGVDGLKTGIIKRSGYCVTVTCMRSGQRMIAVVMGYDSAKNRDLFTRQLLDWGYARRANPAEGLARTRKKEAELRNKRPAAPRKRKAARRK